MKRTITFYAAIILITLSIINTKCKNDAGGGKAPKIIKRDTTITLAVYVGYQLKGYQYGPARRITIDSLMWVGKDSTTMKKEWGKYTYYDVSVNIAVKDSISAKAFGIRWKNKDTVIERLVQAPAIYVRDGVTNWDSAVSYLKKYMDTTFLNPTKK